MKVLTIALTLLGAQAFAYNSNYTKIEFGVHTQVETSSKDLALAKVISLQVDVNSTTGAAPVVQVSNRDQKSCAHKQTLLSFSGYDMVSKKYKRTYEIQIERDPSKSCYLVVYSSNSNQDRSRAARVSIFPAK